MTINFKLLHYCSTCFKQKRLLYICSLVRIDIILILSAARQDMYNVLGRC